MPRYKHIDRSPRFLPVVLEAQLIPGSFAHAVHHVVDELDLSAFDAHYRNDVSGAPAFAPSILLKAASLAYAQGAISSRAIEQACRHNVVFMAITANAQPHFTTFADFTSRWRDAIASVFTQVVIILGREGLIGREMLAIDGVKLPSNASKYRSGTRDEFIAQALKLDGQIKAMLDAHHRQDNTAPDSASTSMNDLHARRLARITHEAAKTPRGSARSQWQRAQVQPHR